jgi:molybdate transport system substrate-binding protein
MSAVRIVKRCSFLALAFALGLAAAAPVKAAGPGSITVFAAASLKEAFTAAGPAFTQKTGTAVTFNFGGSDTLATQITQAAPADVFASANVAQMKVVVDAGLVAGDPKTFAHNRLVIIVPKANPAGITTLQSLAKPGTQLVLADPTVPVGNYARATFKKLAGSGSYPVDFAAAIEKNVVSNELDVKAVATKISLGEGEAGVVYATDVTPDLASKVTVIPFPPGASPDAIYPIAVLKNAANPAGARAFVDYILGDGQQYLKARGFISP